MSLAAARGIDGIVAECGGGMMCATCHCYVDDAWSSKTGPRSDDEADMPDCAVARTITGALREGAVRRASFWPGGLVRLTMTSRGTVLTWDAKQRRTEFDETDAHLCRAG